MKNKGILLLISLFISSVFLAQGTTEIIGKMKKGKGQMIYLQKFVNNKLATIDSSKVSFFGKYKFKANNYALTGLTKLNLELPLFCKTEKEIIQLTHYFLQMKST